ncbi:hypothetical protein NDU88_006409 [Pleurodeles waltl]|uniref:Uncharacterized protein n=1 Tax=Pleurodeles waltl TaxID=8319 RepID=A0AAV7UKX3_PLEWA|nr:hypothetical protein NDU88_006409 [Pleurodeles waltl]
MVPLPYRDRNWKEPTCTVLGTDVPEGNSIPTASHLQDDVAIFMIENMSDEHAMGGRPLEEVTVSKPYEPFQ